MTFRLSHITKKVNEPNDNKHSVTDHIHRSYFEQSSARPGQGQKKHEKYGKAAVSVVMYIFHLSLLSCFLLAR